MFKLRKLNILSIIMLSILSLGISTSCQEDQTDQNIVTQDSFGLPGKGDQLCDSSAPLCWNGTDATNARVLMELESGLLLGERTPAEFIAGVRSLDHKLKDEERIALEELSRSLEAIPQGNDPALIEARAIVMKTGFKQAYGRVISGYWGAHSTLFSEVMNTEESLSGSGKADGSTSEIPSSLPTEGDLKPALDELWNQGPLGQYLVTMLTLTGATKFEGSRIPITNREIVTHLPIDFEARDLVDDYSRSAALDSFFAGMTSLIPVAGIWVSVPYGIYAQFKQRARLAIELGVLYGLDPKDSDDFLIIVQSMVAAQGFKELFSSFYQALMGKQSYRMIAGRDGNQFLVGSDEFSERRIKELVHLGMGQLAIYGVRIFASIQAKITGSSLKSVLGQVTFGLTTLADITIDYFTINSMGRELRYALHPWGWATYLEGMPLLANEEYRRCAHATLIRTARVDGNVNELEAMLMHDALLRPFHSEEPPEGAQLVMPYSHYKGASWVAFTNHDTLLSQIETALDDYPSVCLASTWAEEDRFTQLSLLSWIELMAHTDGPLSIEEEEFLQEIGELFSVQSEEVRVYNAMRERVASYPRAFGYVSTALWTWNRGNYDEVELATSNETRQEIWRVMR